MNSPKESLNSELHFIFQKALKIGKTIRTSIPLSQKMPSLNDTLKKMLEGLLDIKKRPNILFVGTSELNQKLIQLLKHSQMNLFIASRSNERGEQFARKYLMRNYDWNDLKYWPYFDGIVLATNCPETLIKPQTTLPYKKRLVLDLSVPRNVCSKVQGLGGVQLWNIDQLNKIVRKHRKFKSGDLMQVDFLVQRAVFTHWSLFKHRKEHAQRARSAI